MAPASTSDSASRNRIDRIEVRWPGGGEDLVKDLQANQLLTITEGAGVTEKLPLGGKEG